MQLSAVSSAHTLRPEWNLRGRLPRETPKTRLSSCCAGSNPTTNMTPRKDGDFLRLKRELVMRKQCKRKHYVNPLASFAAIERQKPIPRDTYLDVAILSYLNLDHLSRGLVPRVALTKPEVDPSAIQWTTAMLLGVSLAKQAMHAGNKAGGLELLRIAESAYHAFADAADRSNKSTSGYIVLNSDQLRKSRLFCNHFDSVLQRCSIGNLVDATADAERALIKGGFKLA